MGHPGMLYASDAGGELHLYPSVTMNARAVISDMIGGQSKFMPDDLCILIASGFFGDHTHDGREFVYILAPTGMGWVEGDLIKRQR